VLVAQILRGNIGFHPPWVLPFGNGLDLGHVMPSFGGRVYTRSSPILGQHRAAWGSLSYSNSLTAQSTALATAFAEPLFATVYTLSSPVLGAAPGSMGQLKLFQ
jgi:hypothetical protein